MAIFEQRLVSLRKKAKLSQAEAARQLNISNQALYHYEHGREPSYDKLIKFALFYKTTTDYLVGLSNVRSPEKEKNYIDVKNKSIALDFTEVTSIENNLNEYNVSHADISKIMCFGEIFEEEYNEYIRSEVVFDALPFEAMKAIFSLANITKSNHNTETVALNCMKLGIKLENICRDFYKTYLKKRGEKPNGEKE